jgi:hypothetical protein
VKRPNEIEGIPGTLTHGFREQPIVERRLPQNVIEAMAEAGIAARAIELRSYTMGVCSILIGHEPAGVNLEKLWHLTISTPSRHPTWDEIKIARYRLLPLDLCFAIMLPPPGYYVNLPEQDHVFQLWEVTDPRAQWTTG